MGGQHGRHIDKQRVSGRELPCLQVDGLQLFEQGRDLVVFVLVGQFAGKPLLAEIPDNKDAHQLATARAGRHE